MTVLHVNAARAPPSDVIAQLQVDGVGMEISLTGQIGLGVFAHIVVDQGDRHNERNISFVVMIYYFKKLLFFI